MIRSLISAIQLHERLVALRLLDGPSGLSTPPVSAPKPAPSLSEYPAVAAAAAAAAAAVELSGVEPLKVCDATIKIDDPASQYLNAHIPGAVYFDINECADVKSGLIRTMPTPELFEDYVNHLGIGDATEVIAYDAVPGCCGLYSAPRVWWLFRVFGHNAVRVLDGGLAKWRSEGRPIVSLAEHPVPKRPRPAGAFRAKYKPLLHRRFDHIQDTIARGGTSSGGMKIIDARSPEKYEEGHIETALNLHYASLLDETRGIMKTSDQVSKLFAKVGVDLRKEGFKFAAHCHTGVTACGVCLAAHAAAEAKGVSVTTSLFDGSWQEWTKRGARIVAKTAKRETA